ncbi:MAG TPA: peptidoglycan-binding domain-containing protein [Thermoanaerobaculia bacterium]|nr:peptidoglycan-binding domain-containing protein [Thermoanaerobaculia bacterium]
MASFRLGSSGEEVMKIQQRLKELGFYTGALDGHFGGGTEAAVKAFQAKKKLDVDGVVGPETFRKLFDQEAPPAPSIASEPLAQRCLALTGTFETSTVAPGCFSCVTGDFDKQGISFGALQWNFGQGSLQPILERMLKNHRKVMETAFHEHLPRLEEVLQGDKAATLRFARSIQDPLRHRVQEPWLGMFKAMGRTPECQRIQTEMAADLNRRAKALAKEYGLSSQRALALMFDILVQNGSISSTVKRQILKDFDAFPKNLSPQDLEVRKMRSIANRRAEAAKAEFVKDVRNRKLCIANGEGTVHGIRFHLGEQFGIGLEAF